MPYAPRATLDNPYGPEVRFRTEDVLPPSAFYLSADDVLFFVAESNNPSFGLRIVIRLLMPDGTIRIENYTTLPANQIGNVVLWQIAPAEAYLLSCTVQANQTSQYSIWVQGLVVRGLAQTPVVAEPPSAGMVFLQGYLHGLDLLGWPASPIAEVGTGAGAIRNIQLTAAAGAEWTLYNGGVARYLVLWITSVLATSPAPGNRNATVILTDVGGNGAGRSVSTEIQGPSLTYRYHWFPGAAAFSTTDGHVEAPIPNGLYLPVGWKLSSSTTAIDAADQYSFVQVTVQEWAGLAGA